HPGTLPGTLTAPAGAPPSPARLSVISFNAGDVLERLAQDAADAVGLIRPGTITWIDMEGLGDPATLARLGERFGLHPLAVEDALNVPQRAKVERYDAHFFVVLRMIRGHGEVEEEQVSIFFGPDWVLTVQERRAGDVFDPVREAIRQQRGHVRSAGADYLAYLLVDAVVDGYFPVLEALTDRMETVQDDALAQPTDGTLVAIQELRRDLLVLRRAVWPMREEIGVLQRDDSGLITRETKVFLRDAYDHAVQALEMVEFLREGAASVMEVYLSAQNQRLNQVMKVLTVIATLFIPLTFIASIYGMNFEVMPELRWRYGYLWALSLMGATLGALALYFKRKGWW
ncbi:MAG: magnesium/cobalt transporter CorA, partial [Candidatus Rokuibacteriota bacterium]